MPPPRTCTYATATSNKWRLLPGLKLRRFTDENKPGSSCTLKYGQSMASQMIFEVSVSIHPPIFLDLQIAVPGLTLEAEREAKGKATCKSGRLTESSLHRDLSCCKERRTVPCGFAVSPGLFLPKARTGRLALTTKVSTSLFASYQAKFPYTLFSLGFCRRQSVICPVTFTTPCESCIGTN